MKIVDDYDAKLELWARYPVVAPLPGIPELPSFPPQRFSSYEEMNAWKQELISKIAAAGGVKWKS